MLYGIQQLVMMVEFVELGGTATMQNAVVLVTGFKRGTLFFGWLLFLILNRVVVALVAIIKIVAISIIDPTLLDCCFSVVKPQFFHVLRAG